MEQTIRVTNIRTYPIGMQLQNGQEYTVRPGGFIQQSREDIEWVSSIAPALFAGERQLKLGDRETALDLGFIKDAGSKPMDDEEIRRCLNMSAAKLRQWLDSVNEAYLLDAVYQVAMTMELSTSKLKILQEKMPERDLLPAEAGE